MIVSDFQRARYQASFDLSYGDQLARTPGPSQSSRPGVSERREQAAQQQPAPGQVITVVRALAGDDMPEIVVKRGTSIYVAHESSAQELCIIFWNRTRWTCSCGKGACEHKRAVNEFVFQASQKQKH